MIENNKNNNGNTYEMKEINNENNNFLSVKISDYKQNKSTELKTDNNKNIKKEIDYSSDLLRYKSTKILGMNFYHIGNTYVFGFINKFSEPLFCIDKLWHFHFIIYLIELTIYYVGNYYFYRKIAHWKQTTFNILLITFFIIYTLLVLINPGIIIRNKKGYKLNGYCNICNIYYHQDEKEKVTHCFECDICVKKVDHHCHVVRKCITKRNLILFILMVTNFIVIYIFTLINLIIFTIHYFSEKRKNK